MRTRHGAGKKMFSADSSRYMAQIGAYSQVFKSKHTILFDGVYMVFVVFNDMEFAPHVNLQEEVSCGDTVTISVIEVAKQGRGKTLKALIGFVWEALLAAVDRESAIDELRKPMKDIIAELDELFL